MLGNLRLGSLAPGNHRIEAARKTGVRTHIIPASRFHRSG